MIFVIRAKSAGVYLRLNFLTLNTSFSIATINVGAYLNPQIRGFFTHICYPYASIREIRQTSY